MFTDAMSFFIHAVTSAPPGSHAETLRGQRREADVGSRHAEDIR
jgi:hypothetical protein